MDLLKQTVFALGALGLCACVPDLDTDESLIKAPTILAVQAEPAEPQPGMEVRYRALAVDQNGTLGDGKGTLTWYYCNARKPTAELGPVSQDCFEASKGKLERFDRGAEAVGTLPYQACSFFGPNPPPPETEDSPPGRAADPDGTGGYKQPVVVGLAPKKGEARTVLFEQRFMCGLAGVGPDTSGEFNRRYVPNVNPSIESVRRVTMDGAVEIQEGEVVRVKKGEHVELEARWASCSEEPVCAESCTGYDGSGACPEECSVPVACTGQEDYVWFDGENRELVTRRESLSLAWYTTGGTFDEERTGVAEDERASKLRNTFTAPSKSGNFKLWLVLRDSRGGVGFKELALEVF